MTFPRTVCQHTTHGADRTLTFEDGIEAAAKLCEAMRDVSQTEYESLDAADRDNDHAWYAVQIASKLMLAIRALSHKEPSK